MDLNDERDDRDLLVFSVWKTAILTNEKIGRLFGMTYFSISHIARRWARQLTQLIRVYLLKPVVFSPVFHYSTAM
jgi:hypothetical protein